MSIANASLKISNGPSLKVLPLGLGLMSMSGVYGAADEAEAIATIHRGLDRGINMLDSADMYGWGHNEELLGRALRGRRNEAIVATKFGQTRGPNGSIGVDGRPEYVYQACEASLKRLGIDTIDLYYQHRIDDAVPVEETVGAMARLVEQGKVRALGLSEARPETIRRACAVHPIAAIQNEYSILYRAEGDETLNAIQGTEIVFVGYAPLARGLLAGSLPLKEGADARRAFPRFEPANLKRNLALVERLSRFATVKGCSISELAIAWVMRQGQNVIAIPGTKHVKSVDDNIRALEIDLSPDEIAAIDRLVPVGAAAGERYPPEAMKRAYR